LIRKCLRIFPSLLILDTRILIWMQIPLGKSEVGSKTNTKKQKLFYAPFYV
jgi:hypothetical protein